MSKSMLKVNAGTNLAVRVMQNLIEDGWVFTVRNDIVTHATNESTNEDIFFGNVGELKSWIEMKSEDY